VKAGDADAAVDHLRDHLIRARGRVRDLVQWTTE
jgi:GntR family transcriptional regulator of gluconate operon